MPKTLKELRAERAAKATRGRTALARHNALAAQTTRTETEETELTTLGAEIDGLEAEVTTLDGQIEAQEAQSRRGALFGAPTRAAGAAGRTSEPNPETTGGFRSMSEFATAVRGMVGGNVDARLTATAPAGSYQANAGTSGEGFLVPPEYSRQVWEIAFEQTDLFGMSQPEPIQGNATIKPKDETTPWGAAGVQAAWRAEGTQMLPSKLSLTGEMMTLHELFAFCAASSEVLSDAGMLQNRLTVQAGRAIAWKASDSVMYGDGVGKPLGFMKAKALITVAKDGGQAAKTITVSNLANMLARVLRGQGGRPLWLVNPDILPQLITLVIPNTNLPAYLPNNRPLEGDPTDGYLFGYPVLFTEHAQTLGTTGDISCVNMSGYYSANKTGGPSFDSSIHLWFDQALTAFRWLFRLTGQPYLSAPVQPANGATTKSHFVTLATRA